MKPILSKKQITYKIEDFYVCVWLPFVTVALMVLSAWNIYTPDQILSMSLISEADGNVQVFVNNGEGFNQENSVRAQIKSGQEPSEIKFNLNEFNNIQSLRVDPIDQNKKVIVTKLKLKKKGHWIYNDLLKPEYPIQNSIRFQWNAKKTELEIYPLSADPFFIIEDDFSADPTKLIVTRKTISVISLSILITIISFFCSSLVNQVIATIIYGLIIPISWLKFIQIKYTKWIDRVSRDYELVNPTSCAIAGLFVAILASFYAAEGGLFDENRPSKQSIFAFDITEGSANTMSFLFKTDEYYNTKEHKFVHFSKTERPLTVNISVSEIKKPVLRIRLDPFEGEGNATFRNFRFIKNNGYEIPVKMTDWQPNDDLEIRNETSTSLTLQGLGTNTDPHLKSPELNISVKNRTSFPIQLGFPITVWFFTFLGLLLYNRLQTEGMTHQEIQNLQQM